MMTSGESTSLANYLVSYNSGKTDFSYEALVKEATHYCNTWNSLSQNLDSFEDEKTRFYLGAYLSDEFKSFIIFLRNSGLEIIYAKLKLDSDVIQEAEFNSYLKDAQKHTENVRKEFLKSLDNVEERVEGMEMSEMAHQTNPIKVYTEQIGILKAQLKEINQFGDNSMYAVRRLDFVNNKINEIFQEQHKGLELVHQTLLKINAKTKAKESEISRYIKSISNVLLLFDKNKLIELDFQKIFGNVHNLTVIPFYEEGVIKTFSIDFPIILRQLFTIKFGNEISQFNNHVRHSLLEINGQLRLFANREEDSEIQNEWLGGAIENVKTSLVDNEKILKEILSETSLYYLIYKEPLSKDFSSDYSIRRFLKKNDSIVNFIQNPVQQFNQLLDNIFYKKKPPTENQSIINFVKSWYKDNTNEFYTKIFLNNSEFFDHYFVERTEITERIQLNIENWQMGLGNSIMIYGDRYSGKSSLLNWAKHNCDFYQAIEVFANENLVVGGRKMTMSSDLHENLTFIEKSIEQDKNYLVLIDDIELMRQDDDTATLSNNVRSLLKHLSSAPKNLFFIVSCNTLMARRLNIIFNWEKHFADLIDTSIFKLGMFMDTLIIRHQATKMELLNNEAKLGQNRIRSLGMEIFKKCDNNIGLALLAWCGNVKPDLNLHYYKVQALEFPTLISEHRRIIDLLYNFKKLSFDDIIKFDFMSKANFNKVIGRFRKIGMLKFDGKFLEFTPFVGHALSKQLSYHERNIEYNEYALAVDVESEKNYVELIQDQLIAFPFKAQARLVYFKNISKGHLEIGLHSEEVPSILIKYLNNHPAIQAEFKNNLY